MTTVSVVPEIEPRVDEEKLRLLLAEGHESPELDYKASCNVRERVELVAICKDIGAMNVLGGYIVVGADDRGQPTGQVTAEDVQAFDQANLQAKFRRYLPESVEVRTAAHEIDGNTVIVIYIAPHPDGFVVFERNGSYTDARGREQIELRAGEVFARHGTASERWTQADIIRIRQGLRDRERERWRREFREDVGEMLGAATAGQAVAAAPAATLDWRLDEQTLIAAVIEQVRRDDLIPLELLMTRLPSEARAAIADRDRERLDLILDRLTAIAATLMLIRREDRFDGAVAALVTIYNAGFDSRGMPRGADQGLMPAVVWLDVIERVEALGAFAVRRRDWRAVHALTHQAGTGYDFRERYYLSWLQHGLVMAARANLLGVELGQRGEAVSLLNLALQHINQLPALRPDLPAEDDAQLSSLCQFDMLACLAAAADEDAGYLYPNFAPFFAERSDPAVLAILDDDDLRQQVFPAPDDELAEALREIGRIARAQAGPFAGWHGYEDPRIQRFLIEHPARDA